MWKLPCPASLAVLLLVMAGPAFPESEAREEVFGLWVSPKGTVFSIAEHEGRLQAEVIGMR